MDLKTDIQNRLLKGSDIEANLQGTPPVLSIPILQPCLRSEQLLVTIDTHTGVFTVHVPQYEDNPYVQDIQQCLNEDKSKLETLVSQLRFWVKVLKEDQNLSIKKSISKDILWLNILDIELRIGKQFANKKC